MKYFIYLLFGLSIVSCVSLKSQINTGDKPNFVKDLDTVLTIEYLCNGCISRYPITKYNLWVKNKICYYKKTSVSSSEINNIGNVFNFYNQHSIAIDTNQLLTPNILLSHYYYTNVTLNIRGETLWVKTLPEYYRKTNYDNVFLEWLRLIESSIFLRENR